VLNCYSWILIYIPGSYWGSFIQTKTYMYRRRGFAPGFVNYKKECTRLAVVSDKVYQLLPHGRQFSPGTPASSTTKTGHHDVAEMLLKMDIRNGITFTKYLCLIWSYTCCVDVLCPLITKQIINGLYIWATRRVS
jgi:hypothetical protein